MADVIKKSTNKFTKGLIMDFSPENTRNEVLTHALNATLLTFNGNELSLQNDMGNARVETAYLPDGYMPVGTCEYGGIIYIVSYNPLEDKSQIGCFPSPERNISSDELGRDKEKIDRTAFQKYKNGSPTGDIVNTSQYVLLKNDNLNPGDKFIVCSENAIYGERLKDLLVNDPSGGNTDFNLVSDPVIALNIVSIEDSGKIVYLNSDTKQYTVPHSFSQDGSQKTYNYKYHILGKMAQKGDTYEQASVDIDEYRNVLDSGYSVFKSKTSGKLAILAELVMIDSYSVTHSLVPKVENDNIVEGCFDIVIHTEVSPEITSDNYNTVPKLQYYFLKNSQGYLQNSDGDVFPLFNNDKVNTNFAGVNLNEIYEPITLSEKDLNVPLESAGQFNFPKPETYHGNMASGGGTFNGDSSSYSSTKFSEGKFHRIKYSQIEDNISYYLQINAKFYYYDSSKKEFQEFKDVIINESYTYYIEKTKTVYTNAKRNESNKDETLYKLVSIPQQATKDEIVNKQIEKFAYVEVNKFIPATQEDIINGADLWVKVENGYSEYKLQPEADGEYFIKVVETTLVSMGFDIQEETVKGDVYYFPTTMNYEQATQEDLDIYWNFDEYPYDSQEDKAYGCPITLYYKEIQKEYVPATQNELLNYKELNIVLYYDTSYVDITKSIRDFNDSLGQLFIVVPIDTFVHQSKFVPNTSDNYIEGNQKPSGDYPKDDPISLYTVSNFIPGNLTQENSYLGYQDVKLATIKIPRVVFVNGLDLPFKYDYTLVPCMNYGRLDHLAVSNTVDFSKLHAFNQSDFTTWKYRIDGKQLRLTFGADVFDTYETDKVDGLVLEFYDLWGFAGSIEITDKKSYSGIFTKIISLDSIKAINTKKITGNTYTNTFRHNINIIVDENGLLKLNGNNTYYDGANRGWHIQDEDNDCGTLYSNVVYGVKAYLRRKKSDDEYEFIKKQEFFLYTLPIFNDYYYTVSNFNNLTKPELKLMLTYKMEDSSTISPYNTNIVINGYSKNDDEIISKYLSGFYDENTQLDVTKYYKYSGISRLYLEVGLLKDYEELNISYDPAINEHFSCDLQLINNDSSDTTFNILSDNVSSNDVNQLLNYYDNSNNPIINSDQNYLKFSGEVDDTFQIENIKEYNFLYNKVNSYIPITYNFIVGYKVNIQNIRSTKVPATTVCALYHKQSSGIYNYEDFGIYKNEDNYLSEKMIYNSGNATQEIFGLCRQIQTEGNMQQQCFGTGIEYTQESKKVTIPGKTSTGDPLKLISENLGKLQFCQPHVHGLYEDNITNIATADSAYFINYLPKSENVFGSGLFDNPRYNLSINTKNSVKYNSEFISTVTGEYISMPQDTPKYYVLNFSGLTGKQVELFNRKLLETMKSVYAYNPDYDSLPVNIGDIYIQNNNLKFTSNILSKNAKLNISDINDYIYINNIKFSEYLSNLKTHSDINTDKEQVKLIANLDYCGGTNYYLISELTYRTELPKTLEQELEFNAQNFLVVKHSDGSNTMLTGTPVKKFLYGYSSEYKKLIQLDVSNYSIDESGSLTLNTSQISTNETKYLSIDVTPGMIEQMFTTEGYNYLYTFIGEDGTSTDTIVNLKIEDPSIKTGSGAYKIVAFVPNNNSQDDTEDYKHLYGNSLYIAMDVSSDVGNNNFNLKFNITTQNNENYNYSSTITSMNSENKCRVLKNIEVNDTTDSTLKSIYQFNESTLIKLIYQDYSGVMHGDDVKDFNEYNYVVPGVSVKPSITYTDSNQFSVIGEVSSLPSTSKVMLFKISIDKINLSINRNTNLNAISQDIVYVDVTPQHYKINSIPTRQYKVRNEYNQARLRGSTLTLNDLIYEPNQNGHRLFVNSNLYKCKSSIEAQIYYRDTDQDNTDPINTLYIFTGPSFTYDNLNNE